MEKRRLAEAPALLVSDGDPERAAEDRGTVLFCHGFTASKEVNRPDLEDLARAGFLVVGLDNAGHGDRRPIGLRLDELDPRFRGAPAEQAAAFLALVHQTIAEIPSVLDALAAEGWLSARGAGIVGISMGGYIAYGAALLDRRIRALVSITGTPCWRLGGEESPHRRVDEFHPTAVLSVTCGRDDVVLPEPVAEFHQALAPFYVETPERQRLLYLPESPHLLLPQDWDVAWNETKRWLGRFLSA